MHAIATVQQPGRQDVLPTYSPLAGAEERPKPGRAHKPRRQIVAGSVVSGEATTDASAVQGLTDGIV